MIPLWKVNVPSNTHYKLLFQWYVLCSKIFEYVTSKETWIYRMNSYCYKTTLLKAHCINTPSSFVYAAYRLQSLILTVGITKIGRKGVRRPSFSCILQSISSSQTPALGDLRRGERVASTDPGEALTCPSSAWCKAHKKEGRGPGHLT